jgi:hypothetical protein
MLAGAEMSKTAADPWPKNGTAAQKRTERLLARWRQRRGSAGVSLFVLLPLEQASRLCDAKPLVQTRSLPLRSVVRPPRLALA